MDIGTKIKNARTNANLTQEEVAEELGVSRQTVSNWENEKTYPDIVSVIKMSDLYNISLDHLLKEEKPMSNYLDYLEESTNTVKSHNKLSVYILFGIYFVIWAVSLIAFWFFTDGSDAMGYALLYIWLVLPITTFVISLLLGKNAYTGKWKWFYPIGFGVMYMLVGYLTFSTANMVAVGKINMPDFGMMIEGTMISFAGVGIGALINRAKSKIRQ